MALGNTNKNERNNDMDKKLGMKIKEARINKGLTLQQVANEVGCSPSYIHRIENSERKTFSYKIHQQLIELLDLPASESNHSEKTMDELEKLLSSSREAKSKLLFTLEATNESISKILDDLTEIEKQIEDRLIEIIH